jgi:hypothetical protein
MQPFPPDPKGPGKDWGECSHSPQSPRRFLDRRLLIREGCDHYLLLTLPLRARYDHPMTPPIPQMAIAPGRLLHHMSSGRVPLLCAGIWILAASEALAAETCRFAGTTDYDGRVSVITKAAMAGNTTRIDVVLQFDAVSRLWLHLRYLVEELSEWRNGTLLRVDANTRYVFAGHVVRQQWDDFQRTSDGLQAYRIEGKRPAQFRGQYPRFQQHWDLADFGLPWLDDYAGAAPVRRPDLDLKHPQQTAELQSPFALAFYWVRFLPPHEQPAQVFLPGFKADKTAGVAMTPLAAANGRTWIAHLHHSYLYASPPSTATAEISPDGHLQRLAFALHGAAGSAGGSLQQAGCTGSPSP